MKDDEIEDTKAPLIEHLAELRGRLIRSVIAFLVGMVICFTVWNPIFDFLTAPICSALSDRSQECGLILIKLQEGFFVAVRISLMGGFVLAFPVISYQMWRFVAPGLYRTEKNVFLPFLIASPFMFFLGAAFAFYIVIPLAFDFFLGFQQQGSLARLRRGRTTWGGRGRRIARRNRGDVAARRACGCRHNFPRFGRRIPFSNHKVHSRVRHLLPTSRDAHAPREGRNCNGQGFGPSQEIRNRRNSGCGGGRHAPGRDNSGHTFRCCLRAIRGVDHSGSPGRKEAEQGAGGARVAF